MVLNLKYNLAAVHYVKEVLLLVAIVLSWLGVVLSYEGVAPRETWILAMLAVPPANFAGDLFVSERNALWKGLMKWMVPVLGVTLVGALCIAVPLQMAGLLRVSFDTIIAATAITSIWIPIGVWLGTQIVDD